MRKTTTEGDCFQINLKDGIKTYCKTYKKGVLLFYNVFKKDVFNKSEFLNFEILFFAYVHIDFLSKSNWTFLFNIPLSKVELSSDPLFFKQDILKPSICWLVDIDGKESLVTAKQCLGIERLSVWDYKIIEDRLQDYHYGKENKFVKYSNERLKVGME
jgi:hypothetical protein